MLKTQILSIYHQHMAGVRTLNIVFSAEDYEKLERAKIESGLGWRDFILKCGLGE